MDERDRLAARFEEHRPHLRSVAYRMLGSTGEADDLLRSRQTRREQSLELHMPEPIVGPADGIDPEHEALIGDSVGLALLVVLETLSPAERLAFVMHDVFAVPFDEIGAWWTARPTLPDSSPAGPGDASEERLRAPIRPMPAADVLTALTPGRATGRRAAGG